MDAFHQVRVEARELHDAAVARGADPSRPLELIEYAAASLELELVWLEPDSTSLDGARALFDEQTGTIMASNAGSVADRVVLVAHELGHAKMHIGSIACRELDIDPSRSAEAAPIGLQKVEDYGAHERRELQANVFAREFLFPQGAARARGLAGETAMGIAQALDLPLDLIRQQMFDALLLPEIDEPKQQDLAPAADPQADESQDRAVAHRNAPFLLQAGPGTGKTRTLIRRIVSLLEEGVDPASILVLTFSNRAAGELSERLARIAPDAAPKIWVGTFHGFGLDLVRRHHDRLNLQPNPALFDRSDAIAVLEEILPTLTLTHYKNLWDPEMVLRDMLTAISRAKDELIGPAAYRSLADAMRLAADNDEEARVAAEKALEVARVYELYEAALAQHGGVDFGDLIARPTRLLESDEEVRTMVRLRHRHILVDEYQDINRASARLVQAVAGDGKRLWVVGDARQSIYRFRGASPANMTSFERDYAGSRVDRLEVNYRSTAEVVNTFVAFSEEMGASAGMLPLKLEARCGSSGRRPTLRVLKTLEDEISAVAANVRALEGEGVRLRDQAVLCRSNRRLNELAAGLEARGIPVLHLGSLFERDEIRDLLALLSLAVDPFGAGLVRLAARARYAIPLDDVAKLLATRKGSEAPTLAALGNLATTPGLSAAGREGLQRLAADLSGLSGSGSAWNFLSEYLLDRTDAAQALAQETSVSGRMRAVAVWQFLNFARDLGPVGGGQPIRRILDRVRQLVLLNEERDLRQAPAAALTMDAVRLMTVHGSKGLEFEAVHLPGMTVSSFPTRGPPERCPPPRGLIAGSDGEDPKEFAKRSQAAEEECLFFVALSRAKRRLALYRAELQPNGTTKRSPSPYLDVVAGHLRPDPVSALLVSPTAGLGQVSVSVAWPADWRLTDSALDLYDQCPRRFFYTHVLGLGGRRRMTPFGQAHDCLYEAIRLVSEARAAGALDLAAIEAAFEEIWARRGPVGHAFEAEYRALARRLLDNLVRSGEGRRFRAREALTVSVGAGRVHVEPSELLEEAGGLVVIRRVRTGYSRSNEYDRLTYALYLMAGEANFGSAYRVEAHHLTDDSLEPVELTDRKMRTRRERTEEIVTGLADGRFPPDPDAVTCPRCPHFFICAATPDGPLNLA